MSFTKFDREVLRKAMSILNREHQHKAAEEIRRVLWNEKKEDDDGRC